MPVPRARCNPTNPNSVVWAWGPGVSSFVAPNGTGLPILGDSGCDFLQVGLRVFVRARGGGGAVRFGYTRGLPPHRRPRPTVPYLAAQAPQGVRRRCASALLRNFEGV